MRPAERQRAPTIKKALAGAQKQHNPTSPAGEHMQRNHKTTKETEGSTDNTCAEHSALDQSKTRSQPKRKHGKGAYGKGGRGRGTIVTFLIGHYTYLVTGSGGQCQSTSSHRARCCFAQLNPVPSLLECRLAI